MEQISATDINKKNEVLVQHTNMQRKMIRLMASQINYI
jgi:hypothetical protein